MKMKAKYKKYKTKNKNFVDDNEDSNPKSFLQ